ncbi:MAG: alcohol dehydrogenase catalytic domain-containing protein [Rubrivivax sp.]
MKKTYRAMQVASPGVLALVERPTPQPGAGDVLIRVEACGVCGADAADIEKAGPPRVPGHEVVGRIVALGAGVPSIWRAGQRVGVGRLGGHCNECEQCRQGRFQLCLNQPVVGSSRDGGYAEMMLARGTALVAIPDELSAEEAAPILCAGVATFNALKKCGAQAGDTVAVLGIGGLGHLALQYARRMGFKVVAIGRGADVAADAPALGAHVCIDNRVEDAAAVLKRMGGAQAIVTTVDDADTVAALLAGLAPEGRLVLLNPGKGALPVPAGLLVGGQRSIVGSITGTPHDNEKALQFSVLVDVRPRIERLPLEQAADALRRLRSGQVRYRLVLTMAGSH